MMPWSITTVVCSNTAARGNTGATQRASIARSTLVNGFSIIFIGHKKAPLGGAFILTYKLSSGAELQFLQPHDGLVAGIESHSWCVHPCNQQPVSYTHLTLP